MPERVGPGFAPVAAKNARALILGSFPSPKSREAGFYYGHPQNRFWPVMAALLGAPLPGDIAAKKALITQNGLALWDTIRFCTIEGASDASVRDAEPNDVPSLMRTCGVEAVFCNGAASWRLYEKYLAQQSLVHAVRLPSTSPANAAWTLPRLTAAWGAALGPYLPGRPIATEEVLLYNENKFPAPGGER